MDGNSCTNRIFPPLGIAVAQIRLAPILKEACLRLAPASF